MKEIKKSISKKFNPFYDSKFLISTEDDDTRRMLVELTKEELIQLRDEINATLRVMCGSEMEEH